MLTEEQARDIWKILVDTCGASPRPDEEETFVHTQTREDCREWRFGGSLGMGGKFRTRNTGLVRFGEQDHAGSSWVENDRGPWGVDCYREDETPERRRMVKKANKRIYDLYKGYAFRAFSWHDAM